MNNVKTRIKNPKVFKRMKKMHKGYNKDIKLLIFKLIFQHSSKDEQFLRATESLITDPEDVPRL